MRLLVFAFVSALLAATAAPMKPIFDGKTLKGWKQCNGKATYKVENGAIVGTTVEGSPNSFLCSEKVYGDFVLEYETWADDVLNSGVQIRAHQYATDVEVDTFDGTKVVKRKQPAGRVYGYQVETANESSGASGGIYDEARRGWLHNISSDPVASKALKANQWNKYRVEAIGDHIRVTVNGVPCADLVDPLDQVGFIGLQVHSFKGDKPAQVRWRNVRIEDRGRHVWKPLDAKGWVSTGGDWKIENGVITGKANEPSQRGYFLRPESWTDFTVRLEYRALKGNSGVFFRMGDFEKGTEPNRMGFEIEVDPTRDAGGFQEPGKDARGWIHHTGPAAELAYYKPNDWNQMVIHAHGGRIAVFINGVKTYEARNDPGRKSGRFALQANSRQPMEVQYRNVELLTPAR